MARISPVRATTAERSAGYGVCRRMVRSTPDSVGAHGSPAADSRRRGLVTSAYRYVECAAHKPLVTPARDP